MHTWTHLHTHTYTRKLTQTQYMQTHKHTSLHTCTHRHTTFIYNIHMPTYIHSGTTHTHTSTMDTQMNAHTCAYMSTHVHILSRVHILRRQTTALTWLSGAGPGLVPRTLGASASFHLSLPSRRCLLWLPPDVLDASGCLKDPEAGGLPDHPQMSPRHGDMLRGARHSKGTHCPAKSLDVHHTEASGQAG